jgi:hypothetical protein
MEIPFLNIVLHEPDVALTDWFLAGECLLFAVLLLRMRTGTIARTLSVTLFLSLMLASILGGMYHGFFPLKTTTAGGWWIWIGTMFSIGLTSASLLVLSLNMIRPAFTKTALTLATIALAGYIYWITAVSHEFLIAVLFYLPMLLLFLAVLVRRLFAQKDRSVIAGICSVFLMLIAAGVQQLHIGLHPQYFNHNALYHVIQAIALLLLFITIKSLIRPARV